MNKSDSQYVPDAYSCESRLASDDEVELKLNPDQILINEVELKLNPD